MVLFRSPAFFEFTLALFLIYAAALLFASRALLFEAVQLNELPLFALNACLFEAASLFKFFTTSILLALSALLFEAAHSFLSA